jgi:nicotinic acid mononucleotide adenylyltransferase
MVVLFPLSSVPFILLLIVCTSLSYPSVAFNQNQNQKHCHRHSHSQYMLRGLQNSLFCQSSSSSTRSISLPRSTASSILTMTSSFSTNSPLWVSDTGKKGRDFSLERLQDRMENFVAANAGECRMVLSIAGGGGHFISTMASTSGASKCLLEGSINYDRESYRRYVEKDLDSDTFRYSSALSAQYAAESSLRRALQLSAAADPAFGNYPLQYMNRSLGLGCASALRSSSSRKDATSRAFLCAHKLEGGLLVEMEVRLAKETLPNITEMSVSSDVSDPIGGSSFNSGSSSNVSSSSSSTRRTRFQEDVVVSHCILDCLEYTVSDDDRNATGASQRREWEYSTKQGDTIKTIVTKAAVQTRTEVIRQAVKDITSGSDEAVLLLPTESNSFQAVSGLTAGLPPHSLIFPGSFNPCHQGHVSLVKESLKVSNTQTAWFELSLTNADKPPLEADDVVQRLDNFWNLKDMPAQWGIVLTDAPLFKQKVDILQPLQVLRSFPGGKGKQAQAPLSFVIGTDTLVRILNPKYYNDSHQEMLRVVQELPCHFVVGGRLAQKTPTDSTPVFISGQSELDELPAALQSKFTLMPDFRFDVSSTELRKQMSTEDAAEKTS